MTKRKELYGETFINTTDSEEILEPIKLSYYKIFHLEDTLQEDKVTYGIEIVKEHKDNNIAMTETKELEHRIAEEEHANALLELLKTYKVTPIGLQDVLEDFEKAQ